MESGDHFSSHQRRAKSGSGLDLEQPKPENANVNANNTGSDGAPAVREQDQYMPIANVIRIMRRILPSHAKISDDAKETIQECVSEYISFVTGEANERCQREQRKTITADDVLWAMGKLGFDDYVEPLTLFLTRYRESDSDRGGSIRAVEQFKPGGFHVVPPGPYPYGMIDPTAAMGGFYRDQVGGESSSSQQAGMAVFDPFAQFK